MPKLNITHLVSRLQQRIEQLENGDALEARDINALLNSEQQNELKDLWAKQQALRKTQRQPKTDAEKERIGWKTIRDVRLEVFRKALAEVQDGLGDGISALQRDREIKGARVFLDAYSKAKAEGGNAWSAAEIALTRNGFRMAGSIGLTKRDKEISELEDALKKRFEAELSNEEKEQLALLKAHEKGLKSRKG